jgi:hypothetical protein
MSAGAINNKPQNVSLRQKRGRVRAAGRAVIDEFDKVGVVVGIGSSDRC